jgi:hypothetical protein
MGYMFETEIEAIMNAVRARTIGEEDSITLRHLLGANIHPSIKAYFRAEVEKTLEQERAHEQRSPRFPYAHPGVRSLQQQIDRLLVLQYQFDRQEFESLLDQSVHFEFNYLCRPQWTLLNFVMGNQRRVSTVEMERKLPCCIDYRYFADLLKRYFADRGVVDITYEEFKSLLERIDREVIGRHSDADLARMLQALVDFTAVGAGTGRDANGLQLLPTNAAVVFFEDKQLPDVTKMLERLRDVDGIDALSIPHLAGIVASVRSGEQMPASTSSEMAPTAEEPPASEEPNLPATEPPAPYPERTPAEPPFPVSAFMPESRPEVPSDAALAGTNESVSATPAGMADVHTLFTDAEQKKFLKTVFKKDEHAFTMTLDELNHIETWQETSLFLDSLFVSIDVDPFSEPAVHFTDRLYTRFFPDQAQGG